MNSRDASSAPTKTFEKVVVAPGIAPKATSVSHCVVFRFEDHALRRIETPPRHKAIGELVGKWSKDEKRRALLTQARQWAADTFHGEDGDTVRTLRLRKGWSQVQLAAELGTSQPHVARIERGTENLAIETCRKLCAALNVDMNTLDQALRRQEAIAQAKAHR
ncbi:MAG: helix-turn-helix transcriptional regulator [Pseudomonadota bacterium]|jgi:ribosome-binding protein aMBF1 (putative translation factor)